MAGWTCQRQTAGKVCKHKNTGRARKCSVCGKPRPPRRRPAHLAALSDYTYEDYIRFNGGKEECGICGAPPPPNRKLDRDHDHSGQGRPRGLLCRRCNRQLKRTLTSSWMQKALAYLERALGIDLR